MINQAFKTQKPPATDADASISLGDKTYAFIMPFSPARDRSTEVAELLEKIKEGVKETQRNTREVTPAQWHSQCWAILAGGWWWRRNPHLGDTISLLVV